MTTEGLIRSTDVAAVLFEHGGHRSLTGMLTSAEVRALAEEYRTEFEVDGVPLADALDALARNADQRAVIKKHVAGGIR